MWFINAIIALLTSAARTGPEDAKNNLREWFRSLRAFPRLTLLAGCGVIFVAVAGYELSASADSLNVGPDAVVMGRVAPNATIGAGSVVIGPTDDHGNTIVNKPMVAGRCAHGGSGDIVLGAHAGGAGGGTSDPSCEK
jgi:hypothetical protein